MSGNVQLNIQAGGGEIFGLGYLGYAGFKGATFVHQVGCQLVGIFRQKPDFVVAEVNGNRIVIVAVAWLPAKLQCGAFVNVVVHIRKLVVAQTSQCTGKN